MRKFEILQELQNVTQKHEVIQYCWKNDANNLAQYRIATNQFVTITVSVKCNKIGYACILLCQLLLFWLMELKFVTNL